MSTDVLEMLTEEQLEAALKLKREKKIAQETQEREAYETLKHDTVMALTGKANALSNLLKTFKQEAFTEMKTIYDLLCKYSKRRESDKGNFTLEISEGMRITYRNQDLGYFDERSVQAEKHIIDFVKERFQGDVKAQKMITTLLERRRGKLDIKLVQKLYAMENDFDHPSWIEGIKLLKESWTASESKSYIRFEVKVDSEWQPILLDFASI